jgi:hypothetical protein
MASLAAHVALAADVAIDALPYVDPEYADPGTSSCSICWACMCVCVRALSAKATGTAAAAIKATVDALIAAELKTMRPNPDALAALPVRPLNDTVRRHPLGPFSPSLLATSWTSLVRTDGVVWCAKATPLVAAEVARVAAGRAAAKMDTTRYQMEAPDAAHASDPAAWARAVDNARAQLQHHLTRLANLSLLSQHGANAWLVHNYQTEALLRTLQSDVDRLQKDILDMNVRRKADQVPHHPRIE